MSDDQRTANVVGGARVTARKRQLARELRQGATSSEAIAWELLRSRRLFGLKFRRQQVILGFVVDFYCPELQLAIELDGPVHDKTVDYDRLRQRRLENRGIRVLRLRNDDLDPDSLAALVKPLVPVVSPAPVVVSPSPFMERGLGGEV